MNRLLQSILTLITLISLIAAAACNKDEKTFQFKNEVKHFKEAQKLYFEASRYLRKVTGGSSVVGSISEDELNTFVEKLSYAQKEAKLVSDDTLFKIHPELPEAYHSIFLQCVEKQIKGFRDFDPKASIEGQTLHNLWIDWWHGHYKQFATF